MVFLPSKGIDFASCPARPVHDTVYPFLCAVFRDFCSPCAIFLTPVLFSALIASIEKQFKMLSRAGTSLSERSTALNPAGIYIIHICISRYALFPAGFRPAERFSH